MAVVGTRNIDSLIKKERMQEEKLKKKHMLSPKMQTKQKRNF